MIRLLLLLLIPVLFLIGCRKNSSGEPKTTADEIVARNVKGIVINICNDSGMVGIPVYLYVFHNNKKEKFYKTVSGLAGSYLFENAELHTSDAYSYAIYIPTNSGDVPVDSASCGLIGTTMSFNFKESDILMKPRVVPCFIGITFYFFRDKTSVDSDTILARFSQNTYHKNRPDYPFSFGEASLGSRKSFHSGINTYPMGKYNIFIDKWIGGVHTQSKDSIYINYADTAAYVVHW